MTPIADGFRALVRIPVTIGVLLEVADDLKPRQLPGVDIVVPMIFEQGRHGSGRQ